MSTGRNASTAGTGTTHARGITATSAIKNNLKQSKMEKRVFDLKPGDRFSYCGSDVTWKVISFSDNLRILSIQSERTGKKETYDPTEYFKGRQYRQAMKGDRRIIIHQ